MKLNYTSLQHPVEPVEIADAGELGPAADGRLGPVLVLPLHGHLAPAAWAAATARGPGLRLGYVQTRRRRAPRVAVAGRCASFASAGCSPATSTAGAGVRRRARGDQHSSGRSTRRPRGLGWDAILCGPGPGILGSATRLGHGGHGGARERPRRAGARACRRCSRRGMSSSDPRPRHRGLSHHTATVLELLLGSGARPGAGDRARRMAARGDDGRRPVDSAERARRAARCSATTATTWRSSRSTSTATRRSGLPAQTMGRTIDEDPLFFAAAARRRSGRWPRRRRELGLSAWSGSASKTVYEGRIATVRVEEFRYPDGDDRGARGRRPPGRGCDGRPRRPSTSTWSASRARRSGRPPCSSCRRASSTSRARIRARVRAARARGGDRQVARRSWQRAEALLHEPRVRRGGGHVYLATGLERRERRGRRGGADRDRARGRWRDLDGAIDECRGREVADRPDALPRPAVRAADA